MAYSYVIVPLCFVMLVSMAAATTYRVGGSMGWTVPERNATSYNQWAEKNRFQIGDSLLFVYRPDKDSVLLVDENSYNSCDTSSFIDRFDDGNTVYTFTRSGAFYFISGNRENCQKNEKLVVVVMARRGIQPGLAPSPAASLASPPQPSAGVVEITPSTSPPPPPSGASVNVAGLMGTLGIAVVSFFYTS